jgi:hypothetical protein
MDFSHVQSKWVTPNTLNGAVCCILDQSLQFLYCNQAWDDFCLQNGGSASTYGEHLLGHYLGEFLPDVLSKFYISHLLHVMRNGGPWHHCYYCSSPSEFRIYQLDALELQDARELLISHSVIYASPHAEHVVTPIVSVHYTAEGTVKMCCHCRKTARLDNSGWDWIPAFVAERPARCEVCLCSECSRFYETGLGGPSAYIASNR